MPFLLTSSDDMKIKLWDWDKNWSESQVFEGHAHYVMMISWNPKDTTIFASCSLDRSIKVWGATGGSAAAHFTLNGHQKGVNCVEYAPTGEKPYLISGSDDKTVRIWDYQTRQCINTLDGHTNNVSTALFHPQLPIILSGSEDGAVKVWHSATYRLEQTLEYRLERVWSIATMKGSTAAAIGYDEGTVVIKLGSEEPIASMQGGKIIIAKGNEIQTANLKQADEAGEGKDGERLALSMKDMGATELYPQYVAHHPNGRLFAVCGDGEWVVYTSQVLRNKSFGQAQEFVWAYNGSYATRDANNKISVFVDFKEAFSFKPSFAVEEIYGGRLLGVRGAEYICFFDWTEYRLIHRIDVVPKQVIWNEEGAQLVLTCADSFYLLSHDQALVQAAIASGAQTDDDGLEGAFELMDEKTEKVSSACWVGDCFVYIESSQRLKYVVAGNTEVIAHLDRDQYLLGYLPDHSKLYLIDKELSVTPFTLHLALVNYQSAIMKKDFDTASQCFKQLPESLHTKVARFLESQGFQSEALDISKDDEHRFDLAVTLGKLDMAADIIVNINASGNHAVPPRGKWKLLGDVALEQGNFTLAKRCYAEAEDISAMFLVQTACGDAKSLKETAKLANDKGIDNIAVLCYVLLGDVKSALGVLIKAGRLPEACFFARTYCPSELSSSIELWRKDLAEVNKDMADSLADPQKHPDLFPDIGLTVAAEKIFAAKKMQRPSPPSAYESERSTMEMDVIEQMKSLGPEGFQKMIFGSAALAPSEPAAQPKPAPSAPVPQPQTEPAAPPAPAPEAVQLAPETTGAETPQDAPEVAAVAGDALI
jgi:coatomer subunit beta'